MEPSKQLRVFVDANVLIRGITFPRYPYEVLRLAARHKITLVISPSVLADARHYLSTLFPDHLPKLDGLLSAWDIPQSGHGLEPRSPGCY